jgi:hypothetical protein
MCNGGEAASGMGSLGYFPLYRFIDMEAPWCIER